MDKVYALVVRTRVMDGALKVDYYGLFDSKEEARAYGDEQKFAARPDHFNMGSVEIALIAKPCVEITVEVGVPERVDGIKWIDATVKDYDAEGFEEDDVVEIDDDGCEFVRWTL